MIFHFNGERTTSKMFSKVPARDPGFRTGERSCKFALPSLRKSWRSYEPQACREFAALTMIVQKEFEVLVNCASPVCFGTIHEH